MHASIVLATCASLLAIFSIGCSSSSLNSARNNYFSGNYKEAAESLNEEEISEKDRVLFLMERGMIHQAAGNYTNSSQDLIEAYDILESTTEFSVSRDTGSMILNDNVQQYRGVPFERTLLHVFTAQSHLLMGNWEGAGVEARRIIESLTPEVKGDYPDDAYSRYMAGFCLGMAGDQGNVGLQYRLAQEQAPQLTIDDRTGYIYPVAYSRTNGPIEKMTLGQYELVVFAMIGRSPTGEQLLKNRKSFAPAGYVNVVVDGSASGRSYQLTDVVNLAFSTKEKKAILEMAKTVSRTAIKEGVADSLDDDNPALGALFRIIMIGMLEQPDTRRWETLPRSLQVARIPLTDPPENITINFMSASGVPIRSLTTTTPTANNGRTFIMVVRDMKPVL